MLFPNKKPQHFEYKFRIKAGGFLFGILLIIHLVLITLQSMHTFNIKHYIYTYMYNTS